ncbi:MAG TPA: extracellular solute-binding protein [Methylomirabilota bacterium]|nr:extracellular solute-binding protein [Methylomirabilota bacterium]
MRPAGLARAVLGVVGVALLAGACGRSPDGRETVTFSISLAEDERATVRDVLRRFETASGLRVALASITSADLPEKLTVEIGAGRPTIDLFAQDNLALRVLVDRGLVQPVADVPVPGPVLPIVRPPDFAGTRYFLPFRPNVQVTYANVARFRAAGLEPPRTLAELETVARAFRARAGAPKVTLSLAEGGGAAVTLAELIVSFGGDPLVLDDAGSVAAVEYLARLWREGLLAPESLLAKYDTQVDYLVGETTWLAPNWPFTSGVLERQDLLDRFQVYEGWRGPVRAAHVVGGDVLGIPRGVDGGRRARAVRLAEFLMSRDAQERLAAGNAWPAIRADARAPTTPGRQQTADAVQRALAAGWLRPPVPYWPAVGDALDEVVRRVLQRGEPVRPVLAALHARIAEAARRAGAPYPPPR